MDDLDEKNRRAAGSGSIQDAFHRVRGRQILLTIATYGLVAVGAAGHRRGWYEGFPGVISRPAAVLVAVFLLLLVGGWMNWRCPDCGTSLGKRLSPRRCRDCGVRLRD